MLEYKITSSNEIRFNCPFCEQKGKTPDKKFHLYIHPEKFVFICFRCSSTGSINSLPQEYKESVIKIKNLLSSIQYHRESIYRETPSLPEGFVETKSRLADLQYIENYIAYRLKTNIKTVRSELSSYYSLALRGTDPWIKFISTNMFAEQDYFILRKPYSHLFLNPTGEKKLFKIGFDKSNLYNNNDTKIVLVEGVFDALSVYLRNKIPSIAILGKSMSRRQILELKENYDGIDIAVCLDKDAFSEAIKLARTLSLIFEKSKISLIKIRKEVQAKDPNELVGLIFDPKFTIEIFSGYLLNHPKLFENL